MNTFTIVLLIVLVLMILIAVGLYFLGNKAKKKQAEQETMLEGMKQTTSMLIIDKKRLKLKESGLPQMVIDSTPWYLRWSKLPIVKAKVGPQVLNLVADEKIYDQIPVKKEVKATVAGIYITDIKGIRGGLSGREEKPKSKFKQFIETLQEKAGAKPLDSKKK